jgi:lysophospholipase L1-like esterase
MTHHFFRDLRSDRVACKLLYTVFLLVTFVSCYKGSTQLPLAAPPNVAVVPQDRLSVGWWAERHAQVVAEARQHPDTQLLLIGDSITNNYIKEQKPDQNFVPTWQQFYAPLKALNMGFSGDTTANVLWRLQNHEVDGLRPKVAMILIGTNNIHPGDQSAADIEGGIDAVVAELQHRLPSTQILLLGILPRDISQEATERIRSVNSYLQREYANVQRVTYLDIGSVFMKDGVLNKALFYDSRLPKPGKSLHPDTRGQYMMAEAIDPTLEKLMASFKTDQ